MTEKDPNKNDDEFYYGFTGEDKKGKEQKPEEDKQKKILCCLAYFFGLLFFLPLIFYPEDEFAKFHANQSLVILLAGILFSAVCGLLGRIPNIGFLFGIVGGIIGVLLVIACIFGILFVVRGEQKKLPLLGLFKIIR